MSLAAPPSPQAVNHAPAALRSLYGPIAPELAQVEEILRREMTSRHPYVDEIVRYGCLLGGKRLRPALLLLTAKALGQVTPEHLTLAAVVEMIHTATLVHDDVLDGAGVRRQLATVNARWDNEASILLGDFLFSHAFYLASGTGSAQACRLIGRATNLVCEGELRQKGVRGDYNICEPTYLEIITGKTAELTACSCRLGAQFAGASSETCEQFDLFGRELGIAFQIADDILDLTGNEATTGKSLGTDVEKQQPTLPILHALSVLAEPQRQELLALLHGGASQLPAIRSCLLEAGSFAYAQRKAVAFAEKAASRLASLPPSPARDELISAANFSVRRNA